MRGHLVAVATLSAVVSCGGGSDTESTVSRPTPETPTTVAPPVDATSSTTDAPAPSAWRIASTATGVLESATDVRCSSDTIAVLDASSLEEVIWWSIDDGATWQSRKPAEGVEISLLTIDDEVLLAESVQGDVTMRRLTLKAVRPDGTLEEVVRSTEGLTDDGRPLAERNGEFVPVEVSEALTTSDGTLAAAGSGFWFTNSSVGVLTAFGATSADGASWAIHPLPDTGERTFPGAVLDGPAGPVLAAWNVDGSLSLHRLQDPAAEVHRLALGTDSYTVQGYAGLNEYAAVIDFGGDRPRILLSSPDGVAWSTTELDPAAIVDGAAAALTAAPVDGELALVVSKRAEVGLESLLVVGAPDATDVEPIDVGGAFVFALCQRPDGSLMALATREGTLTVAIREPR